MSELPKSWEIVPLGQFVESEKGKKPKNQKETSDSKFKYPYVDIEAFEENIIKSWTDGDGCRFCFESDFLMVWDGSRSGLVGKGMNGALGSTLVRINFPEIQNTYAYYFLLSKFQEINTRAKGSGTPHVDPDLLWSYDFPIPPLSEQKRIVAKIEELFSELDNGIESLKTAREQLAIYRQSILKHAFEGKLTEQWREENKVNLPSTKELLEQIKEEREQSYAEQIEGWKLDVKEWERHGKNGKKPSKPKKIKELEQFSSSELNKLPDIKQNLWDWVKIDKICSNDQYAIKAGPFGSALKKEFYVPKGYKIYGQEQVISGDPYYGDYFIDTTKYRELETCKTAPKDILISLVGTVGRVLILPDDCCEGIINPRLVKISPNLNYYRPKFFKYFFESAFVRSLYKTLAKGTTMDVLNLGIIQSLPFPLCSLGEQDKVIQEIESRLSVVEQVENEIETELQKTEALRQSILKQAFFGKLIAQDPADEPAAVLLERIKAEKQSSSKPTKKRKAA